MLDPVTVTNGTTRDSATVTIPQNMVIITLLFFVA